MTSIGFEDSQARRALIHNEAALAAHMNNGATAGPGVGDSDSVVNAGSVLPAHVPRAARPLRRQGDDYFRRSPCWDENATHQH